MCPYDALLMCLKGPLEYGEEKAFILEVDKGGEWNEQA